MTYTPQPELIQLEENELRFTSLTHPRVISAFIDIINSFFTQPERHLILNFKHTQRAFPNVCVPLAGIVENLSLLGFEFEFYYESSYLKNTSIKMPLRVSSHPEAIEKSSLDKIWKFESTSDIYLLNNAFVNELSRVIVCEKGVLEGFNWSINEVLDNVLQHSGKRYGYVMGQVHESTKNFAFCVYDSGQGIYNSLLQSAHLPKSPAAALELAVQEGVTRDKRIGQGNGLWGLHQIITENTGRLNITSSSACYSLTNNDHVTFENLPQLPRDNGCIVDFQIDYGKEISISRALGGYEPPNLKIESLEDERGHIIFTLQHHPAGVGTRTSGAQLRHEVLNTYKQSNQPITLDFTGVSIVSSSFADELIGKLVTALSFYGFNNIIKLKGMNPNVQSIVQRSVAQRMMYSFDDHQPVEEEE